MPAPPIYGTMARAGELGGLLSHGSLVWVRSSRRSLGLPVLRLRLMSETKTVGDAIRSSCRKAPSPWEASAT